MEFSITNSKTDLEVIKATADALKPYLAELRAAYEHDGYEKAECSIRLPADGTYRAAIREAVAAKKASELAYVIVAGIGGSSLGPKAVYDAVFGYDDALAPARRPKLVFLENIDPEAIGVLAARLKDEGIETRQVVVLLVSKSGNTTESLANFEILIKSLPYAAEELSSRMLFITDRDSSLWQAGEEKGIAVVEIPKNVGGRFSVFSAVGLVPLELAGISTEPLIKSAQSMIERCLSEDSTVNPALQAAAVFYRHYQAGKNINEAFIFDPRLESLGKWYRQLV
ncbi:MAG TPA: hypothetical protein VEB60_00050, partial [Candidatus Paceibacterota bacterium]|nr:hypothetical protein [Candidatus Paceibacterota bacterium]